VTDTAFVLAQLGDGPRTTMQLITASIYERGCGLTAHSRVADLRRDGHDIRCARIGSRDGRGVYEYTLIQKPVQLELVV
jgi:hypothetical protein